MPQNSTPAVGVIVLGPYRSGTSVTAQVLSALGVDFGPKRHFVPANNKNPGGFFERLDINRANEKLIESAGQTLAYPDDPQELAKKADVRKYVIRGYELEKYRSVLGRQKDPRLCATLWAWVESGFVDRDRLRIVHVRRKLEPTVRSGMSFDSIRAFCDGTEEGVRTMLARYAELAQWHVDELKLPTLSFDYEELIKEPEKVVRRIADFLEVSDPKAIRKAAGIIGKGKGMLRLQLERYFIRRARGG